MEITRREFLKYSGATALALAAIPIWDNAGLARFMELGTDPMGILVDTTRCIGCRLCQQACKAKNQLPTDASMQMPYGTTYPEQLSASTFTIVEFLSVDGGGDPAGSRPAKKQCMHCVDPACASVCPVAAIYKTERGPVVYDAERCIGCRYCMAACPFNIPKFEWASGNPRIRKCDMCADLIERGQPPACVQACPVQALTFGPRTQLIGEAQARVGAAPEKYLPYIYGLAEVGGTSVIYLADVSFDTLGFDVNLPKTSLPNLTWPVMEKIPMVAIGVGLLLGVVSWWTHRAGKKGEEKIDVTSKRLRKWLRDGNVRS